MDNYRITFYDKKRKQLFIMNINNCSQDWAIDEAEDILKINPEAYTYTINLSL